MISTAFAKIMYKQGLIRENEIVYYSFMIDNIISKLIYHIIILSLGLIFHRFAEAVLYILVMTLKKTAGGAHAPTPLLCGIISYGHAVLTILLAEVLHLPRLFEWSLLMVSIIVILILCPVDNKNKRLSLSSKNRLKIATIILLFINIGIYIFFKISTTSIYSNIILIII